MRKNNLGPTRAVKDLPLRAFDRLPPMFRHALKEAPSDLAFGFIAREIRRAERSLGRKLPDDEQRSMALKLSTWLAEEVAFDAYVAYGPEHPQARVPSREELRRRRYCALVDTAWWQKRAGPSQ